MVSQALRAARPAAHASRTGRAGVSVMWIFSGSALCRAAHERSPCRSVRRDEPRTAARRIVPRSLRAAQRSGSLLRAMPNTSSIDSPVESRSSHPCSRASLSRRGQASARPPPAGSRSRRRRLRGRGREASPALRRRRCGRSRRRARPRPVRGPYARARRRGSPAMRQARRRRGRRRSRRGRPLPFAARPRTGARPPRPSEARRRRRSRRHPPLAAFSIAWMAAPMSPGSHQAVTASPSRRASPRGRRGRMAGSISRRPPEASEMIVVGISAQPRRPRPRGAAPLPGETRAWPSLLPSSRTSLRRPSAERTGLGPDPRRARTSGRVPASRWRPARRRPRLRGLDEASENRPAGRGDTTRERTGGHARRRRTTRCTPSATAATRGARSRRTSSRR